MTDQIGTEDPQIDRFKWQPDDVTILTKEEAEAVIKANEEWEKSQQ